MQCSPFLNNTELRCRLLEDYQLSSKLAEKGEALLSNLESWLFSYPQFSTLRVSTHLVSMEEAESKLNKLLEKIYFRKCGENFVLPLVFPHPEVSGVLVIGNSEKTMVQPCSKEIIVDYICGSSVLRGADVFIPGVKGSSRVVEKGDVVSVYADLSGRCLKGWITPYDGKKLFLGNGVMQCDRHHLFKVGNRGVAAEMTASVSNLPPLQQEELGCEMFLQNLPSIICSHILDPKSGDLVLDMCAAPGGKSTSLGILMQNQGTVISLDRKKKIYQVQENAEMFGLSCIQAYAYDSTSAVDSSKTAEDADILRSSGTVPYPPFPCELFDHVLLDAPCSALGQRPQLINCLTPNELRSYPCLQKKLFKVAFELLKVGGFLVYCTCSVTLAENEAVVKWALDKFPSLHLAPQFPHIGGTGLPIDGLSEDQLSMLQRFQPNFNTTDDIKSKNYNLDTIGFFIAKFVKTKS